MALVFVDGFSHYATADITKKYDSTGGTATISNTGGRGNRGMLTFSGTTSGAALTKSLATARATVIVGFAYNLTTPGFNDGVFFSFRQITAGQGVVLCVTQDGTIQASRVNNGSTLTLLGSSRPGVLRQSSWDYVEAKIFCSATVGTVQVKVNGVTELNLTNVNTDQSATGLFTAVSLGNLRNGTVPAYIANGSYSDFYVCDTTGSTNNDFLGDIRVDAYLPSSEGTTQQFTPTPSGTHYSTVDEANPNTTDFVTGASGQTELFGYTDVANTPTTIFGVQLNSAVAASDAGTASVRNITRIGGTNYNGASLALSGSQKYLNEVWGTSPATSVAWTKTEINAAEFGLSVV